MLCCHYGVGDSESMCWRWKSRVQWLPSWEAAKHARDSKHLTKHLKSTGRFQDAYLQRYYAASQIHVIVQPLSDTLLSMFQQSYSPSHQPPTGEPNFWSLRVAIPKAGRC